MKNLLLKLAFVALSIDTCYGQISGTGNYYGPPGFANGFQSTQHCGNNPESWVRCSATLDQQTGFLTMYINLETDATHAGPKGQGSAFIYDCNGYLLARVSSAEVGRGGKAPGKAESSTFQATFNLGPDIGNRACKVIVAANCTGVEFRWFNVSLEQVKDAAGFVQQFAMFFF